MVGVKLVSKVQLPSSYSLEEKVFTESQELGTLSRYHNSSLFVCLLACASPLKRLRDFIIN